MSEQPVACSVPLKGTRLIEAGAGTGKTWTIASLFARLVATSDGPGDQPLQAHQILVMTFTRAATRELVDRIRRRLVECQQALEGQLPDEALDPVQRDLVGRFASASQRTEAAWRLARAASSMDTAAVTTIDAWVQRMLREHVLQGSQEPIDEVLERDDALVAQAVRDYWRCEVYPLDERSMTFLSEEIPGVQSLNDWLRPALRLAGTPPLDQDEGTSLQQVLRRTLDHRDTRLAHLKAEWAERIPQIQAWFDEAWSRKPAVLDGQKLKRPHLQGVLKRLSDWVAGADWKIIGWSHGKVGTTSKRLMPDGLWDVFKPNQQPAELPSWSQGLQDLVQEVQSWPGAADVIADHAMERVGRRLHALKQGAGIWTFNDLMRRLSRALEEDPSVVRRIRAAYPVALIDEFQDTSAEQLRLFDHLYDIAADQPDRALLLIGDPKQSIYRFRGADLHSYLAARRSVGDRLHTLDVNHRSASGLVDAVNELFGGVQTSDGAFRHGPDLPFTPARCGRRIAPLGMGSPLGDRPHPVLCGWTETAVRGTAPAREPDARRAAAHLQRLLSDPTAGWVDEQGQWQPLRPRHCSVLVRSGTEAAAMRRAMHAVGLPCAYLSEKERVLESDEARDVLDLLKALAQPEDLEAARRVWASGLMGLPWSVQREQADDTTLWDRRLQQLADWSDCWRRQGIGSAIRRMVIEEGVAHRAQADWRRGERRLTNVLHLAEWLQDHTPPGDHPVDAINLLSLALRGEEGTQLPDPGGTTLLRLESEADVIQIVTIHKSKGLEYPVVVVPFATAVRDGRGASGLSPPVWRDGRWTVPPRGADAAEVMLEEQREDVRLLYVALTRAVRHLWIGAPPRSAREGQASGWPATALGHLLSRDQTDGEPPARLQRWFAAVEQRGHPVWLTIIDQEDGAAPPEASPEMPGGAMAAGQGRSTAEAPTGPSHGPSQTARPARRVVHTPIDGWRISSYSSLLRSMTGSGSLPDWTVMRWDEALDDQAPPLNPNPAGRWHALGSSAALGQCLHELLERAALEGFPSTPDGLLQHDWQRQLEASAWAADSQVIIEWLESVITRPLSPWGVPLQRLERVRAELEFWLPVDRLPVAKLDAWCRRALWPGRDRPVLRASQLEGLLMGFADLVFRQAGRFAVLDYKSNRLGPGPDAYDAGAIESAILEHRYDLQASIYLLALHRLLRLRLGRSYQPARHLGPAQFLFLRGIDHPDGGLVSVRPSDADLADLDRLLGAPQLIFPEAT